MAADDKSPPVIAAMPRRPSQKRGQERVDALLEAADRLLMEHDPSEIGLYDVAKLAGVPPTSAYHFFPTKDAMFLALAERYLGKMHDMVDDEVSGGELECWQDLIAIWYHRVVRYFNENLPARKLFIGSAVGSDIKRMDFRDIQTNAPAMYDVLNRIFEMPYIKDHELKFIVLVGIYDGIWMSSYAAEGYITPAFAREGLRAGLAYLESFIPRIVPFRAPD
jgi:AcrR family transcriptional regulator